MEIGVIRSLFQPTNHSVSVGLWSSISVHAKTIMLSTAVIPNIYIKVIIVLLSFIVLIIRRTFGEGWLAVLKFHQMKVLIFGFSAYVYLSYESDLLPFPLHDP